MHVSMALLSFHHRLAMIPFSYPAQSLVAHGGGVGVLRARLAQFPPPSSLITNLLAQRANFLPLTVNMVLFYLCANEAKIPI